MRRSTMNQSEMVPSDRLVMKLAAMNREARRLKRGAPTIAKLTESWPLPVRLDESGRSGEVLQWLKPAAPAISTELFNCCDDYNIQPAKQVIVTHPLGVHVVVVAHGWVADCRHGILLPVDQFLGAGFRWYAQRSKPRGQFILVREGDKI
jgi:hypothetical protein